MRICRSVPETIEALNQARAGGKTVGLVPTMGALHEGHASLIRAACAENDFVAVSIFVNPTQFAPTEDFGAYPRTFQEDCRLAEEIGAHLIFAPNTADMYPDGACTWVEVTGPLTSILCARSRPTHFRGVTTVVTKLFNIAGPCRAYFGQKDGQQAQVIRRMAADLFMPVEVRIMPLIREADGVALSSRNAYLSPDERRGALVLSRALTEAEEMISQGEREPQAVIDRITARVKAEPLASLDYVEIYNFPDLTEIDGKMSGQIFIGMAVKFGGARLIDNIVVDVIN